MFIIYALASSLFAGVTSILSKIGLKEVDSSLATALRTIIILIFSFIMVLIVGSLTTINTISITTLIFLILSGITTGLSWLCYFKALQIGDVNKVTPIDKSSTILTMILSIILLNEKITILKIISIILIAIGTYIMIEKKKEVKEVDNNRWLLYALGSTIFASLTAILSKIGITNIDSNLGTFIRTIVVLIMAWLVVFITNKQTHINKIDKHSLIFILLSGITTGMSWLCYYKALQIGEASIVVPLDKLSIVFTIAFSYFILKEKLSKKAFLGLVLIVVGTMLLLI